MRKKHNLLIGERTAEDIKIKVGSCYPGTEPKTLDVRGRNLVTEMCIRDRIYGGRASGTNIEIHSGADPATDG